MLLIYNTEKSSIHDDKRLSHCAEIEECGPICMYDMSDWTIGGSYSHKFQNVSVKKILNYGEYIIFSTRDSVRG